ERDCRIRDFVVGHCGEDVAGPGPPQPDDRPAIGDVLDLDRPIGLGDVGPDPTDVRGQVARPRQDPETIRAEASGRHVGEHPAPLVQELAVDRRADRAVNVVGAYPLQECEGTGTVNLDLAEGAEIDDARSLADGAMLLPHPLEPLGPAPAGLARQPARPPPRPGPADPVRAPPSRPWSRSPRRPPGAVRGVPTGAGAGRPRRRRTGIAAGS